MYSNDAPRKDPRQRFTKTAIQNESNNVPRIPREIWKIAEKFHSRMIEKESFRRRNKSFREKSSEMIYVNSNKHRGERSEAIVSCLWICCNDLSSRSVAPLYASQVLASGMITSIKRQSLIILNLDFHPKNRKQTKERGYAITSFDPIRAGRARLCEEFRK